MLLSDAPVCAPVTVINGREVLEKERQADLFDIIKDIG